MSTDILPGDWWFIRQQRIPLKSGSIDAAKSPRSPHKVRQTDRAAGLIELHRISEKAAKTCFHLHSLHMAGVRHYLAELQAVKETCVFTDEDRKGLREQFDFGKGKEWASKFRKEPDRWTLDFVYKFGVLRSAWEPAPPLLDWASCMTWLTMSQAATSGSSLPLDYLLYSVCALELCSKLNPLDGNGASSPRPPNHSKWVNLFEAWQVKALTHAWWYLSVPRPLLSQDHRKELQWLLSNEPSIFFSRAATSSDKIRDALIGWGIQL